MAGFLRRIELATQLALMGYFSTTGLSESLHAMPSSNADTYRKCISSLKRTTSRYQSKNNAYAGFVSG